MPVSPTKSFEDYMREGPLAALDAIEKATGEREVNAIGYCIGGTLLAATLGYMADKRDAVSHRRRFSPRRSISPLPAISGCSSTRSKSQPANGKWRARLSRRQEMANAFNMLR